MRARAFAGLLVVALAGCGSGHSAVQTVHPALAGAHPCPGAPGFTCSSLAVPLDHRGRVPGTLHLAIAAANNRTAPRGVLLVLAGGPGEAGLPIVHGFVARALSAERRQYRIVVMDQRGTGAGALDCPALQAQMGSSDLTPPSPAAVRSCARSLGPRRAFFGTDDVVADMEALRRALGVRSWSVDGISYGTFVGERYALAHPARVRRLVLDSVVPQVDETDLGMAEFAGVRRVLGMVCGAGCLSDLSAVVRRGHLGPQLLDALTFDSIADPTYRRIWNVPRALHAARDGSPGELNAFLAAARRYQRAPADELDQGLHASALCADWRFPWGESAAPLAGRTVALRRAVARLPTAGLYPFDAATASGNGFVRQCLPWPPTPPTPLPHGRITVPALLVNGDHDLSTPLEWARAQLAMMPHGRLVIVPGAGHSTQYRARSDVGRRAVAAFLLSR
ncbi:MAG TPA: alpha/beta fold hydrolase [Gaiellales bacterium]|jgi:pimeloyl-ACP methyl ester carboxylesterase|nr:alpha/beta fold hydrolase [Gaiellales bacterium]